MNVTLFFINFFSPDSLRSCCQRCIDARAYARCVTLTSKHRQRRRRRQRRHREWAVWLWAVKIPGEFFSFFYVPAFNSYKCNKYICKVTWGREGEDVMVVMVVTLSKCTQTNTSTRTKTPHNHSHFWHHHGHDLRSCEVTWCTPCDNLASIPFC
jgi:hypothetical protein